MCISLQGLAGMTAFIACTGRDESDKDRSGTLKDPERNFMHGPTANSHWLIWLNRHFHNWETLVRSGERVLLPGLFQKLNRCWG